MGNIFQNCHAQQTPRLRCQVQLISIHQYTSHSVHLGWRQESQDGWDGQDVCQTAEDWRVQDVGRGVQAQLPVGSVLTTAHWNCRPSWMKNACGSHEIMWRSLTCFILEHWLFVESVVIKSWLSGWLTSCPSNVSFMKSHRTSRLVIWCRCWRWLMLMWNGRLICASNHLPWWCSSCRGLLNAFLIFLFEDAGLAAIYARCLTIQPKDFAHRCPVTALSTLSSSFTCPWGLGPTPTCGSAQIQGLLRWDPLTHWQHSMLNFHG